MCFPRALPPSSLFHAILLSAALCAASAPPAAAQDAAADGQRGDATRTSRQDEAQQVGDGEAVRVTSSLVNVPVSVRDRDGRYVADLRREDFHVYEDGVERQISHFAGVEEPVAVVLLLDVSCSIKSPRDTVAAALSFVEQMRPADSALPIAFGRNIYALLTASTSDRDLLRRRIQLLPDGKQTPCDNGTRLGDAIEFVINHVLKKGAGRKAVILLTDGRDSKLSKPGWGPRTLRDVSELGVPFYSIRLDSYNGPLFTGFPNDPETSKMKDRWSARDINDYITDLAALSGGRYYPAARVEELKKDFAEIGEELRHQYVLAYQPGAHDAKGQRRKLRVRVSRQGVSVRARESYIYDPPSR